MKLLFLALGGILLAQLLHVLGKIVGGAFGRAPLLFASVGPLTVVLEDRYRLKLAEVLEMPTVVYGARRPGTRWHLLVEVWLGAGLPTVVGLALLLSGLQWAGGPIQISALGGIGLGCTLMSFHWLWHLTKELPIVRDDKLLARYWAVRCYLTAGSTREKISDELIQTLISVPDRSLHHGIGLLAWCDLAEEKDEWRIALHAASEAAKIFKDPSNSRFHKARVNLALASAMCGEDPSVGRKWLSQLQGVVDDPLTYHLADAALLALEGADGLEEALQRAEVALEEYRPGAYPSTLEAIERIIARIRARQHVRVLVEQELVGRADA